MPIASVQFVAPLGAAVVATARMSGSAGVGILLRRAGAQWGSGRGAALAAALSIMPSIYLLGWAAQFVAGQPASLLASALAGLPAAAALFLVTGWAEEVGWTAYVLEPSVRRWRPAQAALVIGALWAGIHVIPDLQGGHDATWIAAQRTGTIAQRVIIVWIVLNLGGSVATAALAHAMDNIAWALFTDSGASYDPMRVAPATLLIASVVLLRLREPEGVRG